MRDYPTYTLDDSSADPLKTAMFEMPQEERGPDVVFVMSKKTLSDFVKAEHRRHQAMGMELGPKELETLEPGYEFKDDYLKGIRIMFRAVYLRESIPAGQFKYMNFKDAPET